MSDEERKAFIERLRREAMLKRMKEKQSEDTQPEHEIPSNVMQKYEEKREGDIPFAERLRRRLFEPYPNASKKGK